MILLTSYLIQIVAGGAALAQDPAVIQLNDLLEREAQAERDQALPDVLRFQAKVQPTRDVVIYVDSMGEVGSLESETFALEQIHQIKELRKQFPDHDIVTFTSYDSEKIRRTLEEIMKEYNTVEGLVVKAHGREPYIRFNGEFKLSTSAASGTFSIDPTRPADIEKVFGPLVGRFSDDAKVIFGGCMMIRSLSNSEKLKVLKKVAQNLEMTSGRIYMSETWANHPFIQFLGTPFYKRRHDKMRYLVAQVLFPVSITLASIESAMGNKGNTLTVQDDVFSLYEDTLDNALRNCRSKGEKTGHCIARQMKTDQGRKGGTLKEDGSESSSIFTNVAR